MMSTKKYPRKCPYCPKQFSHCSHYQNHIRIHTKEKPYLCEVCGEGFAERSSLTKHARTHSGERPYSCPHCPLSFKETSAQRRHIQLHFTKTGEIKQIKSNYSKLKKPRKEKNKDTLFVAGEVESCQNSKQNTGPENVDIIKLSNTTQRVKITYGEKDKDETADNLYILKDGNSLIFLEDGIQIDKSENEIVPSMDTATEEFRIISWENVKGIAISNEVEITSEDPVVEIESGLKIHCVKSIADEVVLPQSPSNVCTASIEEDKNIEYTVERSLFHHKNVTYSVKDVLDSERVGEEPRETVTDIIELKDTKTCLEQTANTSDSDTVECALFDHRDMTVRDDPVDNKESKEKAIVVADQKDTDTCLPNNEDAWIGTADNDILLSENLSVIPDVKIEVCKVSFKREGGKRKKTLMYCEFCGNGYDRASRLIVHQRTHTGEKPYVCTICEQAFSVQSSLNKHRRKHSDARPYACSSCKCAYKDSSTLRKHERTHLDEEKKPYQCPICKKYFTRRTNLVIHQRCHSDEKPYLCEICGSSFTQKVAHARHLLLHKNKPYNCKTCNKYYSSQFQLDNHRKLHETEALVAQAELTAYRNGSNILEGQHSSCDLVLRKLSQKQNIDHSKDKTKRFSCTLCSKSYKFYKDLQVHKRCHTGVRPYSCDECGRSYARSSVLARHKLSHLKGKS